LTTTLCFSSFFYFERNDSWNVVDKAIYIIHTKKIARQKQNDHRSNRTKKKERVAMETKATCSISPYLGKHKVTLQNSLISFKESVQK